MPKRRTCIPYFTKQHQRIEENARTLNPVHAFALRQAMKMERLRKVLGARHVR